MNPERKRIGILKAKKLLKMENLWNDDMPSSKLDENSKRFQTLKTTRQPCSCYMCGNPRKHFGELTRQEKKQDEIDKMEMRIVI